MTEKMTINIISAVTKLRSKNFDEISEGHDYLQNLPIKPAELTQIIQHIDDIKVMTEVFGGESVEQLEEEVMEEAVRIFNKIF